MTTVTVTDDALRAYNHAGNTPICVAVSAIVQTVAQILDAGKALESATLDHEPARYEVLAAIGDVPTIEEIPDELDRYEIISRRKGRAAFVAAVFSGVFVSLTDLQRLAPDHLEIVDRREVVHFVRAG